MIAACGCDTRGSLNGTKICDKISGKCNCNMAYSKSNICNKGNGNCKCSKPNYDGRTCEKCANLTYQDFPSCKGKTIKILKNVKIVTFIYIKIIIKLQMIAACGCNTTGTVGNSPVCDKANGACDCKKNYIGTTCNKCANEYTGRKCEQCADGYYGFPNCRGELRWAWIWTG